MNFFDAIWAILTFLGSPLLVGAYVIILLIIHLCATVWWVDSTNSGGAWAMFGNHWVFYYRHWAWAWLAVLFLFVYLPTLIVATDHGGDFSW